MGFEDDSEDEDDDENEDEPVYSRRFSSARA